MKYTITVSQKRAAELGLIGQLDFIDLAIFDLFVAMLASPKVKREEYNETPYILFNHKLVSQQLPLAGINHRNPFGRRMKKLAAAGLIEPHPENQKKAKSLYGPGPIFDHYNLPKPAPEQVHPCTRAGARPAPEQVHNKVSKDKGLSYKEKDYVEKNSEKFPSLPKTTAAILSKSTIFEQLPDAKKKLALDWLIWRVKELRAPFKTTRGLDAQLRKFQNTPIQDLRKAVEIVKNKEWRGIEYGIQAAQKAQKPTNGYNHHPEEKIVYRRTKNRPRPSQPTPISELARKLSTKPDQK